MKPTRIMLVPMGASSSTRPVYISLEKTGKLSFSSNTEMYRYVVVCGEREGGGDEKII